MLNTDNTEQTNDRISHSASWLEKMSEQSKFFTYRFRTKKKIIRLFPCDLDPARVHRQALLTAQTSRSENATARFGAPIEGDTSPIGIGMLQLDLRT